MSKQIGEIDLGHRVLDLCSRYSDSNATFETKKREGVDRGYSKFGYSDAIESAEFPETVGAMEGYIRICRCIAKAYENDDKFKEYIRLLFLQFEKPEIQDLVKKEINPSLSGVQFASDMVGKKMVEVNFGPVGGVPEQALVQDALKDKVFPISADTMFMYLYKALDTRYLEYCKTLGIDPIPMSERKICYVEDDGFYPGSIKLVDELKKLGLNIEVCPKEALALDPSSGKLLLNGREVVDQLILDFHLQKDPKGDIVKAILEGRLCAESSMFASIVLGSKATFGIISTLIQNRSHPLIKRLGINLEDLDLLEDSVTPTYNFSTKFFKNFGINRFDMFSGLRNLGYVAKVTSGGLYGGRGNYDLGDDKDLNRFIKDLRDSTLHSLCVRVKGSESPANEVENGFNTLLSEKVFNDVCDYLEVEISQRSELRENVIKDLTLGSIYQDLNISGGLSKRSLKDLFRKFSKTLLLSLNRSSNEGEVGNLANKIIDYISTYMVHPIVLQPRIKSHVGFETRVSGVVVDSSSTMSVVQGARPGSSVENESIKVMFPIVPMGSKPVLDSESDNASLANQLEPELKSPTEKELSMIKGMRFKNGVVLMCGTGRHVRSLGKVVDNVTGVDISEGYINKAIENTQQKNVKYRRSDVLQYLREAIKEEDKPDLITCSGNSIIYLTPEAQGELIKLVYDRLRKGGMFLLDFTDPDYYKNNLYENGYVNISHTNGFDRLTGRSILSGPEGSTVADNTVYTNGSQEFVNSKSFFHLPSFNTVLRKVYGAGFESLSHSKILDKGFSGMMRDRRVILAKK